MADWLARLTTGVSVDDVDGNSPGEGVGMGVIVCDRLNVNVGAAVVVEVIEKDEGVAGLEMIGEDVWVLLGATDSLIEGLGLRVAIRDAERVLLMEDVREDVIEGLGVDVDSDVLETRGVNVGVFGTLLPEGKGEDGTILELVGVTDGALVCVRDCDCVFVEVCVGV